MQPSRRQVLLAAGVATAAACTTDKPLRPTVPRLADTLRSQAVTREEALVTAYAAALRDHPELTAKLAPVLADHTAHLTALRPDVPATPTPSPSSEPAASPSPRMLAALRRQETEAARAHAAAAEAVTGCEADSLALLLASLAACEASHAALL